MADVLHIHDDDMVDLLVTYADDDQMIRVNIPRKTEQNPFNSWSFNADDEENYLPHIVGRRSLIKEMRDEIAELRNRITALESKAKRQS